MYEGKSRGMRREAEEEKWKEARENTRHAMPKPSLWHFSQISAPCGEMDT
jgi:hypothetical protein